GGKVAAVFGTRRAGVYDLKTARLLKQLQDSSEGSMSYAFSNGEAFAPDSRELAAVMPGPRLVIWDLSGKVIADHVVLVETGIGRSHGVSWAPDGKAILANNALVDRQTGLTLMQFKTPTFYDDVPAMFLS